MDPATGAWQVFREAVKQQRVTLASAITVVVVLIGVFRAPAVPVLLGCGVALTLLLVRKYQRLR